MKIRLIKHIVVSQNIQIPQSKDAPKRRTVTIRSDKKKYRLYSLQASPGCVHVHFEEVKGGRHA